MFNVCHDARESSTLYSKHTIIGAALRGAEHESNRPRFLKGSLEELYTGFNPEYLYMKVCARILR